MPKPTPAELRESVARNRRMDAVWRKQDAQWKKTPPVIPPDDELIRLYALLSACLRSEYLRLDASFARAAAPREVVSLPGALPWMRERWGDLADVQCDITFIVMTQIFPGLGRGVAPDTKKLRLAAAQIAQLRYNWHFLRARFEKAELPTPFTEFLPEFFTYIDPMGAHLDAWPDDFDRHLELRAAEGQWNDESCRTLMTSRAGDGKAFEVHNDRLVEAIKKRLSEPKSPSPR